MILTIACTILAVLVVDQSTEAITDEPKLEIGAESLITAQDSNDNQTNAVIYVGTDEHALDIPSNDLGSADDTLIMDSEWHAQSYEQILNLAYSETFAATIRIND